MKKETLFIAFSKQKGGVGKTTLTVLAASYLHYAKGYHVAVIDCDYPQHSIVNVTFFAGSANGATVFCD